MRLVVDSVIGSDSIARKYGERAFKITEWAWNEWGALLLLLLLLLTLLLLLLLLAVLP
jgi:hypothetical protein